MLTLMRSNEELIFAFTFYIELKTSMQLFDICIYLLKAGWSYAILVSYSFGCIKGSQILYMKVHQVQEIAEGIPEWLIV